MYNFFKFFASRNLFATLLTLVGFIAGVFQLTVINRDMFPKVDFGEMVITTAYPGASPEDVELKVTNELEDEIKGIAGIKNITSASLENMSIIKVTIEPDEEDIEGVKDEITDAVNRVKELPKEVDELPKIVEIKTSIFPVLEIGLSGDVPYRELRKQARILEKKLERVNGVTRVSRNGYRDREVKIEILPEKMKELQIPLDDVIRAIGERNVRRTAGSFESYTSEKNIVTLAQFKDPQEVGEVIVRSTFEGPVIKVKDIAVIRDDFEDVEVESRVNGESAISFVAYKSSAADVIRTADRIKVMLEEHQELLPDNISLVFANDGSRFIRNRFQIVISNGILGLFFVIAFLWLFLNFKTAFWVSVSIPLTVMGVIIVLPFFGFHLDALMLLAIILVLGIVVDDAIIISESIYQEYEKGYTGVDAAVRGIQKVYAPVITTIVTTFIAFAPMFTMPGTMGKFCYVIPLTVSLALLFSLIEVTVALPAHLAPGLVPKDSAKHKEDWFDAVRDKYQALLSRLISGKRAYIIFFIFVSILGVTTYIASQKMNFVLFANKAADTFNVQVELPQGTSLKACGDKIRSIEAILKKEIRENELSSFVSRIGRKGMDPFLADNRENYALITVYLTPFSKRDRTAKEIVAGLKTKTKDLPEFLSIRYNVEGGGPPAGRPITLRVVSSDDVLREKYASKVEDYLNKLQGASDITRDDTKGKKQIEIKLDYEALARSGLNVRDIAQTVRTAYDGEVVTDVRYLDEEVDFRVQFVPDARDDLSYLNNLLVRNKNLQLVKLGKVADFEESVSTASINHYDAERAITIEGDVDKDIITPVKAMDKVLEEFSKEANEKGVLLLVGGEAEETNESVFALLRTLIIALLGIYCMLILLFNSFSQPIMVMLTVPFGISGVIIAFWFHSEPLSFLAVMGLIGLTGVVVNDSLVLVDRYNQLRKEDPSLSDFEIAVLGASQRLRAIIMTSVTTVAGLLPIAYGIGGLDPFLASMALAVGYGLLFATPLTLLLLPCMYLIGGDIGRLANAIFNFLKSLRNKFLAI